MAAGPRAAGMPPGPWPSHVQDSLRERRPVGADVTSRTGADVSARIPTSSPTGQGGPAMRLSGALPRRRRGPERTTMTVTDPAPAVPDEALAPYRVAIP